MNQTRILLVEDDLLILRTLARGLREARNRISEAASAEEAMQDCAKTRPDLAMLDVSMRGLSGLELGRWLAETALTFMRTKSASRPTRPTRCCRI